MESLGKYILSVSSAAFLFAIVRSLIGEKSATAALIKLIGGLFLTFTVISPVKDIKMDAFFDLPFDFSAQASAVVAQGQELKEDHLQDIIKQQSEAYILDKALSYQTVLDVDVTLSEGETPVPSAVQLKGAISPYAKHMLQQWLCNDMGISKENQQWIE